MNRSEKVKTIKEIGDQLKNEEWGLIDLTLRQFEFPTSDSFTGEKFDYIMGSLENAEDDNLTNYLTARPIIKVFSLKYEDDDYLEQIWSWDLDSNGNGVLVFKETPVSGIQLDAWYLGDLEDVTDDGDEIDLPSNISVEFLELLKKKILADYSDQQVEYEKWVEYYGEKAFRKVQHKIMSGGLRRSWFGLTGDDHKYEIVDQWVSSDDNLYTDDDGIFYFYT